MSVNGNDSATSSDKSCSNSNTSQEWQEKELEIRKMKLRIVIAQSISKCIICVAICITIGVVSCHDNSFINRKMENQKTVVSSIEVGMYGGVYD